MSEARFSVDDPVYEHFMQRQLQEGLELAQASDLLRLHVAPVAPPHFIAEFQCNGLVSDGNGEVAIANEFPVGIWFPPDFLRRADPFEMLRNFRADVWHPNVSREHPLICIGNIAPGTESRGHSPSTVRHLLVPGVQPERIQFAEQSSLRMGAAESASLPR